MCRECAEETKQVKLSRGCNRLSRESDAGRVSWQTTTVGFKYEALIYVYERYASR